jgi:hypothetical protein
MSIRVEFGNNTFYYRSVEGRNFWVVWDGRSGDFKNRSGMIVPSQFNVDIYRSAIEQGYTGTDFDKLRTYAPTKETRVSVKPYKTPKVKIASERKAPVRKSSLSNSIKLF